MTITKILFSGFSYLLLFTLSFIPNVWIFFGEPYLIRWTSLIFFIIHTFYIYKFKSLHKKIESILGSKFTSISLFILGIIFFIALPIRNLALGDGILLIENIILETQQSHVHAVRALRSNFVLSTYISTRTVIWVIGLVSNRLVLLRKSDETHVSLSAAHVPPLPHRHLNGRYHQHFIATSAAS